MPLDCSGVIAELAGAGGFRVGLAPGGSCWRTLLTFTLPWWRFGPLILKTVYLLCLGGSKTQEI